MSLHCAALIYPDSVYRLAFRASAVLCLLLLLSAPLSAADVEVAGTVKNEAGESVPDAILLLEELSVSFQTDAAGNFSFLVPPGNHTLRVIAPGYQELRERIRVADGKERILLEIIVSAVLMQFEEIVSAEAEGASPSSVASPFSAVAPKNQSSPSSLLDSLQDIPAVAPLGQGGLFQVPSIRGAARERTILLWESVRVTSERRTGPSFSFVDPTLLDRIEVTRGPASVLYGTGGETGLIQAFSLDPRSSAPRFSAQTGYRTNFSENWQTLSYQSAGPKFQYALGFSRREGGDYETAEGQQFPSGYTRYNLLGKGRWTSEFGVLTFVALPSWTDDIDKSSIDFETRPTIYPKERHQMYLLDWQGVLTDGTYEYQLQGWYHPSSLITENFRLSNGVFTEKADVFNDTDDYGFHVRAGRRVGDDWKIWAGLQVFIRSDVNARQETYAFDSAGNQILTDDFFSLKDAYRSETGLFLAASGKLQKLLITTGVRLNRIFMENEISGFPSTTDYHGTAFAGFNYPLSSSWDAVFNLGTGIRPPTLSERFFTGETGRGSITGNPNLKTERNIEVDGGFRYHQSGTSLAVYLFRNQISDFIDRVRIEGDVFTFENLDDVTISGLEGEGFYRWKDFSLYGNFHWIQGADSQDQEINDIPPDRIVGGLECTRQDQWKASVEFVGQFSKEDPGPTENPIDGVLLINVRGQIRITSELQLNLALKNLTNRFYFASADEKAAPAAGRSFDVELVARF